jgi:hypothetical protein
LERGVTVEKNPLSVPAHWALPILVCNCLAHTPSVVSPVTSKALRRRGQRGANFVRRSTRDSGCIACQTVR